MDKPVDAQTAPSPHESLRPTAGARYLFELSSHAGGAGLYHLTVLAPTATQHFDVSVTLADGSTTLTPTDAIPSLEAGVAPDPQLTVATQFAKVLARTIQARAAQGLVPWLPRMLRWRGPGRGG